MTFVNWFCDMVKALLQVVFVLACIAMILLAGIVMAFVLHEYFLRGGF